MARTATAPKSSSGKSKTVSKADLIRSVAEESNTSRNDVKAVLDQMLNSISDHLDAGKKVQLTGFGTFEVRGRKARTGVRPGTTERIDIPASKYPAFKPGKGLKDKVKK